MGIYWFSTLFGWQAPHGIIFSVLLVVGSMVATYGIWNARYPQVKDVDVMVRHLPAQWQGKMIVQLSDIHLGTIYDAAAMERLAGQVNALAPDVIVLTGDTFDGMDGSLATFTAPLASLSAPHGVYFITGNHETYLGTKKVYALLEKTGIQILHNDVADLGGLMLVGLAYPERSEKVRTQERLAAMYPRYSQRPTILLNHAPVDIDVAQKMDIDVQLSGHTHRGQMFPYNAITNLVFKGYDYGKHEIDDFTIYTTNGVGTWGPPMRIGNTPEIVRIILHTKT